MKIMAIQSFLVVILFPFIYISVFSAVQFRLPFPLLMGGMRILTDSRVDKERKLR